MYVAYMQLLTKLSIGIVQKQNTNRNNAASIVSKHKYLLCELSHFKKRNKHH